MQSFIKRDTTYKGRRVTAYNYVIGYRDAKKISAGMFSNSNLAVIGPDGEANLIVDHSRPITLSRAREIYDAAIKLTGGAYDRISIKLIVFDCPIEETGEDGGCPQLINKTWIYNPKANSLVIWENEMPVYANYNGDIYKNQDALDKSLFQKD